MLDGTFKKGPHNCTNFWMWTSPDVLSVAPKPTSKDRYQEKKNNPSQVFLAFEDTVVEFPQKVMLTPDY